MSQDPWPRETALEGIIASQKAKIERLRAALGKILEASKLPDGSWGSLSHMIQNAYDEGVNEQIVPEMEGK